MGTIKYHASLKAISSKYPILLKGYKTFCSWRLALTSEGER